MAATAAAAGVAAASVTTADAATTADSAGCCRVGVNHVFAFLAQKDVIYCAACVLHNWQDNQDAANDTRDIVGL